ncbi:MAG: VOC family protein [Gemmataceae bacterium]|nr:VOC family protein [Planctomycetia bacterium]MBX3398735.1 VOC family protein [Gemmataceae bacterium]
MYSLMFHAVQPVLPVRDVPAAIRFYERLGFRCSFADDPASPRYAAVNRNGVELHLQWHDAADFRSLESDTLMLRFVVDNPDALFEEYQKQGVVPEGKTVRDTPWGTREFAFFDPDGNGLTFYRSR